MPNRGSTRPFARQGRGDRFSRRLSKIAPDSAARHGALQAGLISLAYKQAIATEMAVKTAPFPFRQWLPLIRPKAWAYASQQGGVSVAETAIPLVDFAIICGSASWGLRFPEDLQEPGAAVVQEAMKFETPWGPTSEWRLLEIGAEQTVDAQPRRVLTVFSHGWPLDRIDHEAQRRVFWVLQQAGVRKILASSTAGSLNRAILQGDFVIANDILELTQTQHSLLPGRLSYDCSGKQMICPGCADVVEGVAKAIWPKDARVYGKAAGLVAGHSWGPRFQTAAEAAAYRLLGADFVNHSLAPEATLAREIGACFVNCTFITVAFNNYFAPPQASILAGGGLDRLAPHASRIALRAVARFPRGSDCLCAKLHSPQPEHYAARR
jgi:5'-methylthioadenosine phosphorylase